MAELTAPTEGVYYQKHMTHHLIPQLPRDWIPALTNVLLIRDPAEVVASYVRSRADVVAEDIGLVQQTELYDQLGGDVPVIDSADFLRDPEGVPALDVRPRRRRRSPTGCCSGRPGRATRTGYGPRTGTARCSASTGFEPYRPAHGGADRRRARGRRAEPAALRAAARRPGPAVILARGLAVEHRAHRRGEQQVQHDERGDQDRAAVAERPAWNAIV